MLFGGTGAADKESTMAEGKSKKPAKQKAQAKAVAKPRPEAKKEAAVKSEAVAKSRAEMKQAVTELTQSVTEVKGFFQSPYRWTMQTGEKLSMVTLDIPWVVLQEIGLSEERASAAKDFNHRFVRGLYGGVDKVATKMGSALSYPFRAIGSAVSKAGSGKAEKKPAAKPKEKVAKAEKKVAKAEEKVAAKSTKAAKSKKATVEKKATEKKAKVEKVAAEVKEKMDEAA